MQTFLPYPEFDLSAKSLDYRRLGKQRVETKQIINALLFGGGWKNHPAVKMWKGHEYALCEYGFAMCHEWKSRGYKDSTEDFFADTLLSLSSSSNSKVKPSWIGNEDFHMSHKSNLIRKFADHYGKLWPNVVNDLPYVWPNAY